MDLQSLFFVTQSIQAIIVSLFFVALLFAVFLFIKMMQEMSEKITRAANESIEAAGEAKKFAEKVGKTIIDYLVIKIIKGLDRGGRRSRGE